MKVRGPETRTDLLILIRILINHKPSPSCLSLPLSLTLAPTGEQLLNCLEGSRRSQSKYLSRARARVSSFWSLTRQEPGGKVEHLCLIEVRRHSGNRSGNLCLAATVLLPDCTLRLTFLTSSCLTSP